MGIIHNKAYQTFESVTSSVRTKVKGEGFAPINAIDKKLNKNDPDYYRKLFEFNPNYTYRILDPGDYVIPPNEYNSYEFIYLFLRAL